MPFTFAQTPGVEVEELPALRQSLDTILQSISETSQELKAKQDELGSKEGTGRQEAVTAEINALSKQMADLERNFSEIATRIDLSVFEDVQEEVVLSWDEQLRSLLDPLFDSLVQLTSRPREIEQLREQLRKLNEQESLAQQGMERLNRLEAHLATPLEEGTGDNAPTQSDGPDSETPAEPSNQLSPLQQAITAELTEWEKRLSDIETELTITQQRLDQCLAMGGSLSESLHNIFNLFFKSRGRNLLVALAAMLAFWLLAHRLFHLIQDHPRIQSIRKTFKFRLFNVVFLISSVIGGIFLFLFVLFLFGDWLLLTLGALTLIGILWTSKQAIAQYWSQMMLLLNVGPVREGERVFLEGVPYRVKNLNFFTTFENPQLNSGILRLPISDLPPMRSKHCHPDDPWFPTHQDDWVVMPDGTHGKITLQTPDFVRLTRLGNSMQTFPTSDFMGMAPLVLSKGYRLSLSFGLDYQDQAEITESIPQKLQTHIAEGLLAHGMDTESYSLNVEFEEAAGSSLNLAIIADFDGNLAKDYAKLKRRLQKLAVDACNTFHYNIPFPQLSLHVHDQDD